MQFAVEAWAPEYGVPADDAGALAGPTQPPELGVEVRADAWAPRRPDPSAGAPRTVVFTDGVRRVDARVWIADPGTDRRLGLCASYAAGAVRTELADRPRAQVVATEVRHGLFSAAADAVSIVTPYATFAPYAAGGDGAEALVLAVQQRMGELEVELADRAGDADLIVIDGPLRGRQHVRGAVGYVKTHHVAYLPPVVSQVIGALRAGERTPLFITSSSWTRYSWYLRLPCAITHEWAGVVRLEACADLTPKAAAELADRAAWALPRFASRPHKDPRAPQNLYPIAGLERALRHRLGDPALLYRGLCRAAAQPAIPDAFDVLAQPPWPAGMTPVT